MSPRPIPEGIGLSPPGYLGQPGLLCLSLGPREQPPSGSLSMDRLLFCLAASLWGQISVLTVLFFTLNIILII